MPSTECGVERTRAPLRSWRKWLSSRWLIVFLLLTSLSLSAQEKRLSVYAPQMFYQVSISDRGKDAYVGLFDILEPIGRVEARVD